MSEETIFRNCTFKHLQPRKGVSLPCIQKKNFVDCDISGIKHILDDKDQESKQNSLSIKREVLKIFKLFIKAGTFKEQKKDYIRTRCDDVIFTKLKKKKVITPYKNPKKPTFQQYRIAPEYYSIMSVIEQGGNVTELQKILSFFEE